MSAIQKTDFELPPWMIALRNAAQNAVKPSDISEIMKKQVELAKKGNTQAVKFVFEQLLGGSAIKGATFIQNNFRDTKEIDGPTRARPGSTEKVEIMRRRMEAGMPITRDDDSNGDDET